MWNGYAQFAGNEFINVARTAAYAEAANAYWFKGCIEGGEDLAAMLGDRVYSSPLQDDAPWTDPDVPESYEFFGFYPLEINGIENSTRSSTIYESTIEGGIPGRLRHGTKQVVFSGLLMGETQAAVDYGMRWLKRVLLAGPCGGPAVSSCLGDDLCYFASPPCIEFCDSDPDQPTAAACVIPFWRTMKKFAFINGPSVTSKHTASDGSGTIWSVTFTGVAGNPFEYGREVPIVQGFLNPNVPNPYVSDVIGYFDTTGYIATDPACPVDVWDALIDPRCPAIVLPPPVKSVPLGCYTPPSNWYRRSFTIPDAYVPNWDVAVPLITVHSPSTDLRNLRIRFYADPFESVSAAIDDGCAFCGDFVVSYIPQGYSITIDGAEQRVYATKPGGDVQRADSLVFSTDGTPFIWPELSCGFGYVVTLDMEQTTHPLPVVDLSLVPRTA